jgi:hypothetical protein
MVDVYVALKQLKRTGPQGATRASGLAGAALHAALISLANQYPDNVRVVSP